MWTQAAFLVSLNMSSVTATSQCCVKQSMRKRSLSWVCSMRIVFCHRSVFVSGRLHAVVAEPALFFSSICTCSGWSQEVTTHSVRLLASEEVIYSSQLPTTHCHGVHETLSSMQKMSRRKNNNCLVRKCRREGRLHRLKKKKQNKKKDKHNPETHDEETVIANTAVQMLVTGRSYHKCLSCSSAIKGLHDKEEIKRIIILISQWLFLMNICSILREVSRGCASYASDK